MKRVEQLGTQPLPLAHHLYSHIKGDMKQAIDPFGEVSIGKKKSFGTELIIMGSEHKIM